MRFSKNKWIISRGFNDWKRGWGNDGKKSLDLMMKKEVSRGVFTDLKDLNMENLSEKTILYF